MASPNHPRQLEPKALCLVKTDDRQGRVYYRETSAGLLCFQRAGAQAFVFLRCSDHGEPISDQPVNATASLDYRPSGDSYTAVQFRAWLQTTTITTEY